MDDGIDTGPLVAQARTAVDPDETAPELEARARDSPGASLLTGSLDRWLRRRASRPSHSPRRAPRSPGRSGARMAVSTRRDRRSSSSDRSVPTSRGPARSVDTARGRLIVWRAARAVRRSTSRRVDSGRDGLATADGTLLLHEVQPAGGRRMPWVEFLRGRAARIVGQRRTRASVRVTDADAPGLSGLTPDALGEWLRDARRPGLPRAPGRATRVVATAVVGCDRRGRGRCRLRSEPSSMPPSGSTRVADTELREADGGLTEKALHRLADGALVESVLMHYPARPGIARATHRVHLEPGRLRRRLPVLRDRRARLRARPRDGRDRRPGPLRRRAGWPSTAGG